MDSDKQKSLSYFRFFIRVYRLWRAFQNKFAKALNVDVKRKTELYTQLSTSATLSDLVYWLQIIASAGIATLGLVQNSTAVIIGAMLISPLMAPILSQGLALATGDLTLGVRSIVNLALSTVLGIAVAIILVTLLPYNDITPEISARTQPNTLDLGIALFSGAIGAVATCREVKGVVTSIPGVAIAVALMPPLCVVGFGLGYAVSGNPKGWGIASGGGLLYLTNLVAITFMAMLVFVALRIDRQKVRDAVRLWRNEDSESKWWMRQIDKVPSLQKAREVRSFSLRLLMILIPLLIIFIPLSNSLSKLRSDFLQKQAENKISVTARNIWEKTYAIDTAGNFRSDIDVLRINEKDEELQIYLRVFDNKPYTQGERTQYINLLASELKRKPETISLQLVEIPTSQREDSKPVIETTPTPITIAQRQASYLQDIGNGLADFSLTPPAIMIDYSVTIKSNSQSILEISYLSKRDIDNDGVIALQENVRRRLNLPNLDLKLQRVSSDIGKILFVKNSSELDSKQTENLEEVGRNLQKYRSLKLRIILASNKNNKELMENRQNSLKEFFANNYSIAADRLVFDETKDDSLAENYQLFIRN